MIDRLPVQYATAELLGPAVELLFRRERQWSHVALYKDNHAERLERIDQLLSEVRLQRTSLRPGDHHLRRPLGIRLDALLKELTEASSPRAHASKRADG